MGLKTSSLWNIAVILYSLDVGQLTNLAPPSNRSSTLWLGVFGAFGFQEPRKLSLLCACVNSYLLSCVWSIKSTQQSVTHWYFIWHHRLQSGTITPQNKDLQNDSWLLLIWKDLTDNENFIMFSSIVFLCEWVSMSVDIILSLLVKRSLWLFLIWNITFF